MIPLERKQIILNMLSKKRFMSTEELCKKLFVSHSTVRRDLVEMESEKLIIRTRGGSMLPQKSTNEQTYNLRENQKQDEKIKIANMASTFIEDGFSLFLDSSTTVNYIVPFLKEFDDLIIITNGLKTALDLTKFKNIQTILIGGTLFPGSSSTVGSRANEVIANYKVNLSLISCRGLDGDGIYEANEPQAIVKQKMIKNSDKKLLLCDSNKFNNKFFYKMAELDSFDYIVTEKKTNDCFLKQIENAGGIIIEA